MSRTIVHFDLDAFFVSAERLQNPALRGKPVIIGGNSKRGVVASCSYETRPYGVHSAMPIKEAKRLCPQAIIVSPTRGLYRYYSQQVTALIDNYAPVWQKASIDEFYLDITGMDRFYGSTDLMHQLKQQIEEKTGLPISWGMATNKTVAKVATEQVKPDGTIQVPTGEEAAFLAPLPIEELPSVGPKSEGKLKYQGVTTIGDLAQYSKEVLVNQFGKKGLVLWERANGLDPTPVMPRSRAKSISHETTFREDTTNTQQLVTVLSRLTEKAGMRLRKKKRVAACITVKLRYSNFETVSKQTKIRYTYKDYDFIRTAKKLFHALYDTNRSVRLIGVRLTKFAHQGYQGQLFERHSHQALYETMDELRERFGNNSIRHGEGI